MPKIECVKHGHARSIDIDTKKADDSNMFDMNDRHKSDAKVMMMIDSRRASSINHSAVFDVSSDRGYLNKDILCSGKDLVESREENKSKVDESGKIDKREKKKCGSYRSQSIGIYPQLLNPLDINPTRSDKVTIKFGDIYKLMGDRPISSEKSFQRKPNNLNRKRPGLPKDKFSIHKIMQGLGNFAERKIKIPKVTSVIDIIRRNSNHMLCRVMKAMKGYRNIEELQVTLEGQKPQLSSMFSNRLGGQFNRQQLDHIRGFFFDAKGMIKPTLQLSASSILRELFKLKEDQILMDVEKKQIAYLNEKINEDPFSLEIIVQLYMSKHHDHSDEGLELFPQATEMFLRLLTEAKSLYFGYLSEKCNKRLKSHIDKTTELKYLVGQSDLKEFVKIRAGTDDQAVFLAGIKRGLGIDWAKGRGIDRGGEMGESITDEEKMFNKKLKSIIENMREICK